MFYFPPNYFFTIHILFGNCMFISFSLFCLYQNDDIFIDLLELFCMQVYFFFLNFVKYIPPSRLPICFLIFVNKVAKSFLLFLVSFLCSKICKL